LLQRPVAIVAPMARTLLAAAVCALLAAAGAPAARAGTLEGGGAGFDYEAAPGESNHVTLTSDGATWTLTDVVPIEVDSDRCRQVAPDSATCPVHAGDPFQDDPS
jgi:hypothetical protein